MLILPEARAAIIRASVFTAVAIISIVCASRAHRSWVRILFLVIAVPATFEAIFGIWAIWLTLHYAAR
jgi:hypothetical protein